MLNSMLGKGVEDNIRAEVLEINKDMPDGIYLYEIYPGFKTWMSKQLMIEVEVALRLKVLEYDR